MLLVKKALSSARDEAALRLRPPRALDDLRPGPVVVSGLLQDARGIGRAARASVMALRAGGFEVIEHDVAAHLRRGIPSPAPRVDGGVWLLHVNAPEMRRVMRLSPELLAAPMLRAGYWFWELPAAPADWLAAARHLHQVWTASRFTQAAFAAQRAAQVRVLLHPLMAIPAAPDRARFGLPADAVIFLAMADARSSFARKNPDGAILAFRKAFAGDDARALLVVKARGAEEHADALARLRETADGAANIRFLHEDMDDAGVAALMASADAVVSLHRAESLGLPVAEGMALGLPVIATRWSGVEDFTDADSILPVAFTLQPVRDAQGVYAESTQSWAEPDLDSAAAAMRALCDDPALRAALGARARAKVAAVLRPTWSEAALGADFLRVARRRVPAGLEAGVERS